MFLKAFETAISHTGTATRAAKAGLCYSRYAHFSSFNQKGDSFPFAYTLGKNATLQALEQAQKETNLAYQIDQKDLLTFDKLSEDANSETYRVFDLYHKKFFALKTLSLDSESAWKQFNLMIRQHYHKSSRLAPIRSFNYSEANKQVKILSELQKTIIGEYAYNRKRQGLPWNNQELKTVLWHLLKIINALKAQGATTEYLKPGHIFFDQKGGKLRAFDYPGASIGDWKFGFPSSSWGWDSLFKSDSMSWSWHVPSGDTMNAFDVAIHTLVQIIDPYAPVDNPAEARAYLKNNYPEFKEELKTIEAKSKGIGFFADHLATLD